MSGTNEVARNLLAQGPGRVDCHANAANTQIIAQHKLAGHIGGTLYTATSTDGSTFTIIVSSLRRLLCLHRSRRLHRLRRLHRMYGLHRMHGLTEARAQAVAALIWGGVR